MPSVTLPKPTSFFFIFFYVLLQTQVIFCENIYQVVICAVFHNEEFFLKEWIDYHKSIGIQHFYLYDNGSDDSSREILIPYVESGEVDVFDWPVNTESQNEYVHNLQLPVYRQALQLIKTKAVWAAFIDIDEFIVPTMHDNLPNMLKEYCEFGGIAVNWQVFGTSKLKHLPQGGRIIEHLTWKAEVNTEVNRLIKMIVQPSLVEQIDDPHYFLFKEGYFAVNTSRKPILPSRYQEVCIDVIRINHYWFGTEDWFRKSKLPRRSKWGLNLSEDGLQNLYDLFNAVEDFSILTVSKRINNEKD